MSSERILLENIPMIPILLKISAGVHAGIHVALRTFWRQPILKEHSTLIDLPLLVL